VTNKSNVYKYAEKLHKQAERELKKLLKKEKKTLLKLVTMPMPTIWKY
jgi:hypothetical protein